MQGYNKSPNNKERKGTKEDAWRDSLRFTVYPYDLADVLRHIAAEGAIVLPDDVVSVVAFKCDEEAFIQYSDENFRQQFKDLQKCRLKTLGIEMFYRL